MVICLLGFVNYLKAIFCCSRQILSDFYQFYQTFYEVFRVFSRSQSNYWVFSSQLNVFH